MASWVDYLSLTLVLAFLGGAGFVTIASIRWFNGVLGATRDLLEKQGVYITTHGVTVRMNKTYDQERYFDDTQRKLVDVVKASSFGTDEKRLFLADLVTHSHPAPQLPGVKKGPFGRTKAAPLPAQSQ